MLPQVGLPGGVFQKLSSHSGAIIKFLARMLSLE